MGVINLQEAGEDIILSFPSYTSVVGKKIYEKKIQKNIVNLLYKNSINTLILAKALKNNQQFINELYEENLNILDGKILFEILLVDCLEYIAKKQNRKLNCLEVTILANDIPNQLLDNLMLVADKVKSVHIVTNNLNRFRKVEEKIREKFGIAIRVSNNKRKSLADAKLILNLDFPEENVNQYKINAHAIFINVNNKIKIYTRLFEGIVIQNYEFKLNAEKEKLLKNERISIKEFDKNDIYEGILLKEKNLFEARKKWMEDGGRITNLIGNNGRICEEEYMNFM